MKRILIVDDNPRNIQLIANILKDYDFEIEYGQDGIEAFSIAQTIKFDLILMDIMMPHQDGFEACENIKKTSLNAETPLIFITAQTSEENITKGFKVGGVDYITKPFNAAELLSRIETHITLKKSKDKLRELNITLEDNLKKTSKNLEITQKKLEDVTSSLGTLDSAKSEFLQIISHEIRTPLNGIIGLLDIFEEMMKNKEEHDFFDMFNASCKRLEKFSLLALEISLLKTKGKDVLKQQPSNLNELVERNISLLNTKLRDKKLKTHIKLEEHIASIDSEYLGRCLLILISNVIKHSPEDGKVTINGKLSDKNYLLTIQDEGPGLPNSVINYGLTPFSTDKHVDGNPGLELYFCKLVTDAHGGSISFKNNDKGAIIELRIPI